MDDQKRYHADAAVNAGGTDIAIVSEIKRRVSTLTGVFDSGANQRLVRWDGALVPGLDNASVMGGRLKVDAYHKIEGHDSIYAIGDVAIMITEKYQRGVPMLASAAKQQGKHLAKNILRSLMGQEMIKFDYNHRGLMATIGRKRAVVDLPKLKFQGAFAWFIWMFVHLFFLAGFRNRLVTFTDWAWNYINCDKALRIIIRPYERKLEGE